MVYNCDQQNEQTPLTLTLWRKNPPDVMLEILGWDRYKTYESIKSVNAAQKPFSLDNWVNEWSKVSETS